MSDSFSSVSLQLASRLVENLTLNSTSYDRSANTSEVAEGLAETVLKFLAAFESISLPDSESGTVDSIRFYLRNDTTERFSSGSTVRFDELYQRLVTLRGDTGFRNQILLLLLSLSRQRAKMNVRRHRRHLDIASHSFDSQIRSSTHDPLPTEMTNGTKEAMRSEMDDSLYGKKQQHEQNAFSSEPFTGAEMGSSHSIASSEPLLVHDVLYVCQGIDGKYIRFNVPTNATELVVLDPAIQISDPTRRLILSLCELGFLFKKVHAFSSSASQRPIDGGPLLPETGGGMDIDGGGANQHSCFTSQAFSYAVSKELSEYYRLMAVLESRASGQLQGAAHGHKSAPSDGVLTLRRLYIWLTEAARKMRILAVLIDSISHLRGGALASALYAHSRTGDPFANKFVMRILRRVSVPMFNMIKTWVFDGEFTDPHQEFFIVDNVRRGKSTPGQGFDWWRMGYTINQQMLPDFVSPALAQQILRTGKSINFLRSRCGDVEWVQERAAECDATEIVSYTDLESLQDLVVDASCKVDDRLIQIMTKKFSLPLHFKALRRYVLLGQGDFVQSLLDGLKPELEKEMSKVSDLVVMGCIRAAIHSSNAMYDDEDVLERLCMKKVGTFTTQSGWDVFVLDYRIDPASPLSTVIPQPMMMEYQKVFRLLWKLKKTECSLNECWNGLRQISRSVHRTDLGVGQRLRELLMLSFIVRSKLSHFCINFQYYIMFEVLESAWKDFTAAADKTTNLDALIGAHEAYIEVILSKCLLDSRPTAECLRALLTDYFRLIDGFAKTVGRLVADAEQIVHFLYARLRETADQRKNWMADARPAMDDVPLEYHQEMKNHFATVVDKYEMFVGSFTERVSGEAHIDLRFLMFRLEFEETGSKHDVDAEAMISEEAMQE